MPTESVQLRTREGATGEAQAEVTRYSAGRRLAVSLTLAVGGTVLGLSTLIIPGVHFVGPWLIPLLSLGIAGYLFRRTMVIGTVRGPCLSCGADMVLDEGGSVGNDAVWLRCPACNTPHELLPPEA